MASDKIVELNTSNFEEAIQGGPILVDFWAEWCGPCRMVAPVLDELAEEMDGKVTIAKVNVDQNQDLSIKYGVQSIPTFLIFENGELKDRLMGAMPKAGFEKFIDRNVAAAAAS